MVLLRRVIGDALRARRQGQNRTLREVSTAANMSLGYLSEIERGQKEASSELLSSICEALGARLSEVLRDVSDTLSVAEEVQGVLTPADAASSPEPSRRAPVSVGAPSAAGAADTPAEQPRRQVRTDGNVSVSVRQQTPLKATLRATRNNRPTDRGRDIIYV